MTAWVARRIVRSTAAAMDLSYACHETHPGVSSFWSDIFAWRQRYLLPLALRIDREAAVSQMVAEGWWG